MLCPACAAHRRIVGAKVDVFYRDPAHQRQLSGGSQGAVTSDMKIADRSMRISTSPVTDAQGKRLGTVVEWWDRTSEVTAEEEVNSVVRKALDGDLLLTRGDGIPNERERGAGTSQTFSPLHVP